MSPRYKKENPYYPFLLFPIHTSHHNHLDGKRVSHSFKHLVHCKMGFGFRRAQSVEQFHATQHASTRQAHTTADRYASMQQMQHALDRINRVHARERGQIERRGSEQLQDIRKKFLEEYRAAEQRHHEDLEDCKRRYTEQVMATCGSPPRSMSGSSKTSV